MYCRKTCRDGYALCMNYCSFCFFILTFETCVCKICSGAVIWRRLVLLVLPETKVSPVRPEFSPEEDYAYEY